MGLYLIAMIGDKLEKVLGRRGQLAVFLPNQDVAGTGCWSEGNKGNSGIMEEVGHSFDGQAVIAAGPNQDDGVAGLVVASSNIELALIKFEDIADFIADDVAVGDDQGQLVEVVTGETLLLG